jgi:DNA-binding LacI/PurR family transcriptional regulator
VIDMATGTSEAFLRDLVVRNIPVVVVGKEPRTYSTHAVLFDGPLAVSQIGRDLLLSGHRRVAAVEPRQCTVVADTLRKVAARYAPEATVDACFPNDVATMIDNGVTAFVCQSVDWARQVREQLDKRSIKVPGQVSLVAVGTTSDEQPVSGYFLHRSEKVNAIVQLLNDTQNARPTTLWLAGRFVDRGTTSPLAALGPETNAMRYGAVSA